MKRVHIVITVVAIALLAAQTYRYEKLRTLSANLLAITVPAAALLQECARRLPGDDKTGYSP
jgi:hypothetical protein